MLKSISLAALVVFMAALSAPCESSAQVIYLVRHAERERGGDDPGLTKEGKQRANALADVLRSVPLKAAFITQLRRTKDTAAPTLKSKKLRAKRIRDRDSATLVAALRGLGSRDRALVVGHSYTIPKVLRELGVNRTRAAGLE